MIQFTTDCPICDDIAVVSEGLMICRSCGLNAPYRSRGNGEVTEKSKPTTIKPVAVVQERAVLPPKVQIEPVREIAVMKPDEPMVAEKPKELAVVQKRKKVEVKPRVKQIGDYRYRRYVYTMGEIWLRRAGFAVAASILLLACIVTIEMIKNDPLPAPNERGSPRDGMEKYLEEHSPMVRSRQDILDDLLRDDGVAITPKQPKREPLLLSPRSLPTQVSRDLSKLRNHLRARELTEAMSIWKDALQRYCNSEYECENLEATRRLLEEYSRFWEVLDTHLVDGHEIHFDNGTSGGFVTEAKPNMLLVTFNSKLHRYARKKQRGFSGDLMNVIDSSTRTEDVLILLRGLEDRFKDFPGEYDQLRGVFLLSEGRELKAKEALTRAVNMASLGSNRTVRAGSIIQIAKMLLQLIPPSVNIDSIVRY